MNHRCRNCGALLPLSARSQRHWNSVWYVTWRFCKEGCRQSYLLKFADEQQRRRAVQILFRPQS